MNRVPGTRHEGALLALALAALAACGGSEQAPKPSPGAAPAWAPAAATASGTSAAAPIGRIIDLKPERSCSHSSDAPRVSLVMQETTVADLLSTLSLFSGTAIRVDGADLQDVRVNASLESVPWDCVVDELARVLTLERKLTDAGIVLSAGGATVTAPPP